MGPEKEIAGSEFGKKEQKTLISEEALFSSRGFRKVRKEFPHGSIHPGGDVLKNMAVMMQFYRRWGHSLSPGICFAEVVERVEKTTRKITRYPESLYSAAKDGECFDEVEYYSRCVLEEGEARTKEK
ncbi:MAG: uncharacterized protein A8A55_0713 [Amphiamblys sp. WSBS2006]|nr:MAG: uncharacterized protein A8A55_0713 [Amphiamblys sp. WSBS2006]